MPDDMAELVNKFYRSMEGNAMNSHYWNEYNRAGLTPWERRQVKCPTCPGDYDYRRTIAGALMISACPSCEAKRRRKQDRLFWQVLFWFVVGLALLCFARYFVAVS